MCATPMNFHGQVGIQPRFPTSIPYTVPHSNINSQGHCKEEASLRYLAHNKCSYSIFKNTTPPKVILFFLMKTSNVSAGKHLPFPFSVLHYFLLSCHLLFPLLTIITLSYTMGYRISFTHFLSTPLLKPTLDKSSTR